MNVLFNEACGYHFVGEGLVDCNVIANECLHLGKRSDCNESSISNRDSLCSWLLGIDCDEFLCNVDRGLTQG